MLVTCTMSLAGLYTHLQCRLSPLRSSSVDTSYIVARSIYLCIKGTICMNWIYKCSDTLLRCRPESIASVVNGIDILNGISVYRCTSKRIVSYCYRFISGWFSQSPYCLGWVCRTCDPIEEGSKPCLITSSRLHIRISFGTSADPLSFRLGYAFRRALNKYSEICGGAVNIAILTATRFSTVYDPVSWMDSIRL